MVFKDLEKTFVFQNWVTPRAYENLANQRNEARIQKLTFERQLEQVNKAVAKMSG